MVEMNAHSAFPTGGIDGKFRVGRSGCDSAHKLGAGALQRRRAGEPGRAPPRWFFPRHAGTVVRTMRLQDSPCREPAWSRGPGGEPDNLLGSHPPAEDRGLPRVRLTVVVSDHAASAAGMSVV